MRPTRHRARFHTDRVVAARRARYARERADGVPGQADKRLSYGALADRDPWDCGRSCPLCHAEKLVEPRRSRERARWRREWDLP